MTRVEAMAIRLRVAARCLMGQRLLLNSSFRVADVARCCGSTWRSIHVPSLCQASAATAAAARAPLDLDRRHGSRWQRRCSMMHWSRRPLTKSFGQSLALNLNLDTNRCLCGRWQAHRGRRSSIGTVEALQVSDLAELQKPEEEEEEENSIEAGDGDVWGNDEFEEGDYIEEEGNDGGEEEDAVVSSLDGGLEGETGDNSEMEDEDWEEEWSEMGDECVGGIDLGNGGEVANKALEVAQGILRDHPDFSDDFSLYGFQIAERSSSANVRVALDKLSDLYGSPTCEEMEQYLTLYWDRLKEEVERLRLRDKGAGATPEGQSSQYPDPDGIHVEVTSPGVEREVKVPSELDRFKELPMTVAYTERMIPTEDWMGLKKRNAGSKKGRAFGEDENKTAVVEVEGEADCSEELRAAVVMEQRGNERERVEVLSFVEHDESAGTTVWKVADVRFNREAGGRKGTKLTRKQRDRRVVIRLNDLSEVRLFLDF